MAERRPVVVLDNGGLGQLPLGDTLPGAGSGGGSGGIQAPVYVDLLGKADPYTLTPAEAAASSLVFSPGIATPRTVIVTGDGQRTVRNATTQTLQFWPNTASGNKAELLTDEQAVVFLVAERMSQINLPTGPVFPFDPNELDLLLWLDGSRGRWSDAAMTVPAATTVRVWQDQSGNGHHATQTVTGKQGLTQTRGVLMDAVDDAYTTGLNLVRPYTIFVVEKATTVPQTSPKRTINSDSGNFLMSAARSSNSPYLGGQVGNYAVPDTDWHIIELSVSVGASTEYLVDGVDHTDNGTNSQDWGLLTLGAQGDNAEAADTTIGAVMALNGRAASDKLKLRQYLATDYGITL